MDERSRRADETREKLTSPEPRQQDDFESRDELSLRRIGVGQTDALTRRERAERWPIG